ncbi:hypothetical protein [Neobacillus vireti]|uniref:Uncharacterized protein n=1 Tax=Neobacillus vireti LMG 21834 TaxID=1131730 RepID=A0AB94IGL2_9BACI|nr:hypothetical protein [Neobacillus vireti]ETI66250.1 hypothetical protein BAVI_23593 [Neobacillus vireti LMG 21834]KLT19096.1 hypothetical protein AA980_00315 [Neobacillus vireti]
MIKRKPIIIAILIFLVIVIGLTAMFFTKNSTMTTKELPVQQLERSNINEGIIGKYISSNHEYWNNALCWGRSEKFSFAAFQNQYDKYKQNLTEIINGVDNPDLKADFLQAQELLEIANEKKDVKYLIRVHRIFHDLDVKYNGYATSDYFGITQYGKKH